jgi:hypothetical protein
MSYQRLWTDDREIFRYPGLLPVPGFLSPPVAAGVGGARRVDGAVGPGGAREGLLILRSRRRRSRGVGYPSLVRRALFHGHPDSLGAESVNNISIQLLL